MSDPFKFDLQQEWRGAQSSLSLKDCKLYGVYEQDLGPIIERTKMLHNEESHTKPGSEMWHLCDVPVALVHKWKQEGFDLMQMPAAHGPEQQEFLRELRKRMEAEYMTDLMVYKKGW